MTDYISRADAIEAVAQQWLSEASAESPYVNDDDIGAYRTLAENLFKDVPSADAVQGEWTHDGQNFKGGLDWCHCSVCGYKTSTNGISIYRYCPNCGARMKGGVEE